MENTNIEWTDHSFNPFIGCTKVSPGCDNCYAETLNNRMKWTEWGPKGIRRRTSEGNWHKPIQWNAKAERNETRYRVFTASMADVFDNQAPEGALDDLWRLIHKTPYLDWQLLTKRPQKIAERLPANWYPFGYDNVWLGISAENQREYDRRWPYLHTIPARLKFVSYEPALGPLTLDHHNGVFPDWLIAGGESGGGARPCDVQWMRDIRDECLALGINFFFKQWGTWKNNPLKQYEDPLGKGGVLLDGIRHQEIPVTIEWSDVNEAPARHRQMALL